MPRSLVLVVVLVVLVLGCRSSSSSGTSSTAEIRWPDGGGAELVAGDRVVALPADDLGGPSGPPVTQDADAKRFAYPISKGRAASTEARVVYAVGGALFAGPRVKLPVDFAAAPDLDHALGSLFENAGARRAALVTEVKATKGDAGLARMLVDGAHVDAREWDETYAKLPEAKAAEVRTGLLPLLEKGKPTGGLRHAVAVVPLREPARAPALATRIRELADPMREPRASAVMLRALATSDKALAGAVGCDVLGHTPLDTANAKGTSDETDFPGRQELVQAALLGIATEGGDCKHVAALLGDDLCMPWFRCGASGPLDGREATKQDEPPCTKEQLAAAVTKELERPASEIVTLASGPRPSLFALAALASSGKVPPMLVTAHARRRYALVQPAEPSCEAGGAPGSACHCDEPTLRDQTCRHPESKTVSVGLCKFDIDDKQKKLLNVTVAVPP